MPLTPLGSVGLPPFRDSSFDHGDVHAASGRIFVAHTGADCVEVIDGDRQAHVLTIPGCPEASGVLCAQERDLVFAAARAAGKILVIDAVALAVRADLPSGPRPNGLAWDSRRGLLLAADVEDMTARLLDPWTGRPAGRVVLPGRPRWCVFDEERDRFLVNIREPACVAVLGPEPLDLMAAWPVAAVGPHGLDLDGPGGRAFVACDGGFVVALDLHDGSQVGSTEIAGVPDAAWYNARRGLLYVAIGDPGVVDVIDVATMTRCQQLATEPGAHTTAFDALRQRLAVFQPRSCVAALYGET